MLYRVHLYVEVTDTDREGYEWEEVAGRVRARLLRSARKPLDREARLRIQAVTIDQAGDDDS